MIKIKLREKIKLPCRFSPSWVHHASAARSDLCHWLQHGVIKLRRQNQRNRIGKKNKNQNGTKITLEEELKLGISKDQINGFSKRGRSIHKWTDIILNSIYVYCNVI